MSQSFSVDPAQERLAGLISVVLVAVLVALVAGFSQRPEFQYQRPQPQVVQEQGVDPAADPAGHAREYIKRQVDERFQQAIMMYHAKRYEFALKALDRVIELAPNMAEAYVNKGYALMGLGRNEEALRQFHIATEMRPYLANAYWGMAMASEHLGDLEGALGAMRTYIHLSPPNDPLLRKARAALWEWESSLKRGPLPEAEQEWIERRSREWTERNGPEADNAPAGEDGANLLP